MYRITAAVILTISLSTISLAAAIQLPRTGLHACYDTAGKDLPCPGTGQDGELQKGVPWPTPRFTNTDGTIPVNGPVVLDQLTGLMWTRDANFAGKNLSWQQALDFIPQMNSGKGTFGYTDWHLPNQNELLTLGDISETTPALPKGHPFQHIIPYVYWSSSTYMARTDEAWGVVINFDRAVYSEKVVANGFWPVRRAKKGVVDLPRTGQTLCFDTMGRQVACLGTGQDGDLQNGVAWPSPRFTNPDGTTPAKGAVVLDQLTGLMWTRNANPGYTPKTWQEALDFVASLNAGKGAYGYNDWRLPNINELGSVMDMSRAKPALPEGHPFNKLQLNYYWSSSENAMHKDVAWGAHMLFGRMAHDGKANRNNYVWVVRGGN